MTMPKEIASVLSGDARWSITHGDSLAVLQTLPENSVDAVVCDAPYGLSDITTDDVVEALTAWLTGQQYIKKGRGFMQSTWDAFVPGPELWRECLRALKPGGYLLTFAGTRTEDLMGIALRIAGFERVDTFAWLHGQGMIKTVNLERMIAMEQCTLPGRHCASTLPKGSKAKPGDHLCPPTEESLKWKGQGSALRPAHEPIIVCRKPRVGTYAKTVLEYGCALNIDACRVRHANAKDLEDHQKQVASIKARGGSMGESWKNSSDLSGANEVNVDGRTPPNVLLSHSPRCHRVGTRSVKANPTWDTPNRETEPSKFTGTAVSKVRHASRAGEPSADRRYTDSGSTSFAAMPGPRYDDTEEVDVWECEKVCAVRELSAQIGESFSTDAPRHNSAAAHNTTVSMGKSSADWIGHGHADSGSRVRIYPQFSSDPIGEAFPALYQSKPSRTEKEAGLQHFRARTAGEATGSNEDDQRLECPRTGGGRTGGVRNVHSTPKSVDLARWLTKLVARPGQVVLNPFAGSGSEGVAALLEGCRWIGIELNDSEKEPFVSLARARLMHTEGREYVPREELRDKSEKPRQTNLFSLLDQKGAAE